MIYEREDQGSDNQPDEESEPIETEEVEKGGSPPTEETR